MNPAQRQNDTGSGTHTPFPDTGNITYTSNAQVSGEPGIVISQMTAEISSGPLPHPDLLIKYNDCIHDGAERIMKMAEKEQDKRLERQQKSLEANISTRKRGQNMAFALTLFVIVVFLLLVFTGYSTEGFALLGAGFLSVVGLFLEVLKRKKE